jgi:hypothetical protein
MKNEMFVWLLFIALFYAKTVVFPRLGWEVSVKE